MSKNILICGCSFTAESGFNLENFENYHYTSLLKKEYHINFDNIAVGGMSNREIYLRTVENYILQSNNYDAVIVQWSSLSRWWFYKGVDNIEDFTGVSQSDVFGLHSDYAGDLRKILLAEFNNQYVLLKQWLLDCISLGNLLKDRIPYTFCLGFNNLLTDFDDLKYINKFQNVSKELLVILDLCNQPDSFIIHKVDKIKNLMSIVKQLNWNNFSGSDWHNQAVDLSDDHAHPGIISNANWAKSLEPFILSL